MLRWLLQLLRDARPPMTQQDAIAAMRRLLESDTAWVARRDRLQAALRGPS